MEALGVVLIILGTIGGLACLIGGIIASIGELEPGWIFAGIMGCILFIVVFCGVGGTILEPEIDTPDMRIEVNEQVFEGDYEILALDTGVLKFKDSNDGEIITFHLNENDTVKIIDLED